MTFRKKYMAASMPRFLRQTKLGWLPMNFIVGSRLVGVNGGTNLYLDIVMLPESQFPRIKTHVGLGLALTPAPKPGGTTCEPVFILTDTKSVTVPPDEPDPEGYAKFQFMIMFGLIEPDKPVKRDVSFSGTARECTVKEDKIRK